MASSHVETHQNQTTGAPSGGEKRGPGRPRSAAADEAILDAALALFVEAGYESLSMEAVAARAGVAKTTLYRRYPDKAALVAAAADRARPTVEFPDTGSMRDDFVSLFTEIESAMKSPVSLRVFALMVHAFAEHSEFRDAYWQSFVEPRREAFGQILRRGQQRGELDPDADVELLVDVLAGSVMYQLVRPGSEPFAQRMQRIIDLVWGAL